GEHHEIAPAVAVDVGAENRRRRAGEREARRMQDDLRGDRRRGGKRGGEGESERSEAVHASAFYPNVRLRRSLTRRCAVPRGTRECAKGARKTRLACRPGARRPKIGKTRVGARPSQAVSHSTVRPRSSNRLAAVARTRGRRTIAAAGSPP